jgi:hypothetical protein
MIMKYCSILGAYFRARFRCLWLLHGRVQAVGGCWQRFKFSKRTQYYFCTVNALGHLFLRVRGCRLCLDKCLTTVFTVCLKLNPHALPKLNPHALPDTKPGQATSSRQVPYHCHRSAALLVATTAPRAATMLASAPSRPSATSGTRRPCPGETM